MNTRRTHTTTSRSITDKEPFVPRAEAKDASRKARGDCSISTSTSYTQFFKKSPFNDVHERIATDEYFGVSESVSSSDTFRCVHKPDGKVYTEKGLLKRNLLKNLDPIPSDPKWTEKCAPAFGWDMATKLEFLVKDPSILQQKERFLDHLQDFGTISSKGYRIHVLHSVCVVIDYLIESLPKNPDMEEVTTILLRNMGQPILLNTSGEVHKYFDQVSEYIGFMGYLLMRCANDSLFDLVSQAIIWHLSMPDRMRGQKACQLHYTLAAGAPMLYHTVTRMIAVATAHRFPTYLAIALLLACDSVDNCIEMLKDNIIENIFYRFNPYFPERKLPAYDINPLDPQDINVNLGDSSIHMTTTISLLLVILMTLKQYLEKQRHFSKVLPCPDSYSQRCFIWAYRYECRARSHNHERITLTVIAHAMLHCYGDRLAEFSSVFMLDILSLSVHTEVPPRNDWTDDVKMNTFQQDVMFKKILIYFSVALIKTFPHNKFVSSMEFMIENRYWLLGLMYLLDPGLYSLRARWSPPLFAELRKTALQALICTLPRASPNLIKEYGLIRRIMWYIEWYSESPYELSVLYWCVRLMYVVMCHRGEPARRTSLKDLFNTHGIIVLIHLCYTLIEQKNPPVEKSQAILAICLRMLTSAVDNESQVSCCVYSNIKWPVAVNTLARKMLDIVLFSLDKHFIISDRWLISLLNFIWEAIIWKTENRKKFIAKDGIYKLLDIITMTRAPVQCLALALVSDATRAGDSVGQLVTWRAGAAASNAHPGIVKRGATIATLLAAVFREECRFMGVPLDCNGVIENLDSPIMSSEVRNELYNPDFREARSQRTPVCLAAADLAGSRMSKAFSILHMLSEDLKFKVSLADEAYNLYKNIRLAPEDESVLVLCSHYLTLKINEVWTETKVQNPGLLPQDEDILVEFLQIGRGWAKEIQRQQNDVIEAYKKQKAEEESSLYEFLSRVRLNISLDALRTVRCTARSADRALITHALIQDAVHAHHRRITAAQALCDPVIRTYGPKLDDQNITGQNLKVSSICPKDKPKRRCNISLS